MTEKLTRAAIAQMSPAQLRLAVAEYCMGWEWLNHKTVSGRQLLANDDMIIGAFREGDTIEYAALPDYSGEIGAAFLVVDWIFEHASETVYAAFHANLKDQLGTQGVRPSTIMAICICRAALYAAAAESEKEA